MKQGELREAVREGLTPQAKRLLDKFEVVAGAPDGGKRLRELILGLAVRGKLIQCEVRPADHGIVHGLYEIPPSWCWMNLAETVDVVTDGEHLTPPRSANGDVPLVTAKNVRSTYMDLGTTDFVSLDVAQKCWRRCKPQQDDILMVCVGATTGRVCWLASVPDIVLVRSVALIRPNQKIVWPAYLALVLRSPMGQAQIWANVKEQAQPGLYINRMKGLSIPVPTVPEQKRIVAKVDALMKLCDALEASLLRAEDTARKLADALVAELLA